MAVDPFMHIDGRYFDYFRCRMVCRTGRYVDVQIAFDPIFPDTHRYYWKLLFLDDLMDDVVDMLIGTAANRPSPQSLMVPRALGRAIARVPVASTAYGNRNARYILGAGIR